MYQFKIPQNQLTTFANSNIYSRNEQLHAAYVRILLSLSGISASKLEEDKGIDLTCTPLKKDPSTGIPDISSTNLDIQLKTCTSWKTSKNGDSIRYVLKAHNYNQMVQRNIRQYPQRPLVLVLWCMPKNESCCSETPNGLLLKGTCYWYILPPEERTHARGKSKTIRIPKDQTLTLQSVQYIANYIFHDCWREKGGYHRWF
ncbi:DUF4365 domain-containing protein [Pyramidobacter sp.]|uniref:DUF4365 domain-containing protein n=1 Tax=Pyramidobacter sp. TaxID=1943581 RepID=UPI002A761827|nr:DUF4365 domain-containing protein [Pyramidobacter sp.]MDY3213388.1 DUF4365 domain-containing protein [Pyramidobacter sp.]